MMIFKSLYSAFIERIVVNVPLPAKRGKAIGTIDADFVLCTPGLNSSIPNVSSIPIIKMTTFQD